MTAEWLVTPAEVIAAIVGGIAVGVLLLANAVRNPRHRTGAAAAGMYARLIAGMGILLGGIFWTGQVITKATEADPLWADAAVHYIVWVVFSLAVGLGVYIGLRR